MKRRTPLPFNEQEYIADVLRGREDAVQLFSAKGKSERERWVVHEFLKNIHLKYEEGEVQSAVDEPPDVNFRDARFEIKVILDPGRKPHQEFKEAVEQAKAATSAAELLEYCTPRTLSYDEIVNLVSEEAERYAKKYAPSALRMCDFLFYVNLEDVFKYQPASLPSTDRLRKLGCRSISFISGPLGCVLVATESSPRFLRGIEGVVMSFYAPPTHVAE